MKLNLEDDSAIKRYLLGELTEEDQEQLEKRILTDNEYFEHLQLVEDDLVDEYVRGRLSPDEQERFDNLFLSTPERRQKLRFASDLRRYVSTAVAAERPESAESDHRVMSPWQWLLASLRGQNPVMGYSLAAALLLLLVGGTSSIVMNWRLQNQLGRIQAQHDAARGLEQELQRQLGAQQARNGQLAEELEREKNRRAELEQFAKTQQDLLTANIKQLEPTTLSLVLTPGLVRSTGTTKRLIVSSNTSLIQLELYLPGDEYKSYRAALQNEEGAEVVVQNQLKARSIGGNTSVFLTLAADSVSQGDYYVKLSGIAPNGEFEDIAKYSFRVTKKK